MATIEDFEALDLRVGRICTAVVHPTAKKPAYQLEIDFGVVGIKQSSAQLTALYQPEDLIGKQVVAVINFPKRRIGGYESEVLVLGAVHDSGEVILLVPEREAALGDRIR